MTNNINDVEKSVNIDSTNGVTILNLSSFLLAAYNINKTVMLDFVKLEVHPTDLDPNTYLYRWKTKDGRLWKQKIKKVGGVWQMDFSVSDLFTASEAILSRPLRDAVQILIDTLSVTKITCTWV